MNPKFVEDLYAGKDKNKPSKLEPPVSVDRSSEQYHKKIQEALYVRLTGKTVLYKKLVEDYGPLFVKLKDDIKRDKKGNITSHKILVKQVCNVRQIQSPEFSCEREYKPWQNWIDLSVKGIEVSLYSSKGDWIMKPIGLT